MYLWKEQLSALTNWAKRHQLEIDALGLVTLLGSEEINACVGRLVVSRYIEFLPLLGAFVIAGDLFTEKKPGYRIYNITAGITTTELTGWFSRWLKAQGFEQTRSKVRWSADARRPSRVLSFWLPSLLIGLVLNGMLTVLAVLSDDWFGFANAVSMIVSVLVRHILVQQNCAGIDRLIHTARKKGRHGSSGTATAIIILDDSKTITVEGPGYLMGGVFTRQPDIPNPRFYAFTRWCGWLAFAVHILTLGMAALHTQIYTVLLLIGATILTNYKLGCEDSKTWKSITKTVTKGTDQWSCWISSHLQATVSVYPEDWAYWPQNLKDDVRYQANNQDDKGIEAVQNGLAEVLAGLEAHMGSAPGSRGLRLAQDGFAQVQEGLAFIKKRTLLENDQPPAQGHDDEHHSGDESEKPTQFCRGLWSQQAKSPPPDEESKSTIIPQLVKSEGRQDLYVWMNLTEAQWNLLCWWDLVPHGQEWRDEYERKRLYHAARGRKGL